MKYDSESNSIVIDKAAAQFGKYEIEFKIEDNLKAKTTSTFEIDIQKGFVPVYDDDKDEEEDEGFKFEVEEKNPYTNCSAKIVSIGRFGELKIGFFKFPNTT